MAYTHIRLYYKSQRIIKTYMYYIVNVCTAEILAQYTDPYIYQSIPNTKLTLTYYIYRN